MEDHYRDLAQKCAEIARTVADEKARASLHNMAQAWLRLAEGQDDEE
jgi:methionine synthase I (cobalamin-dependent)